MARSLGTETKKISGLLLAVPGISRRGPLLRCFIWYSAAVCVREPGGLVDRMVSRWMAAQWKLSGSCPKIMPCLRQDLAWQRPAVCAGVQLIACLKMFDVGHQDPPIGQDALNECGFRVGKEASNISHETLKPSQIVY